MTEQILKKANQLSEKAAAFQALKEQMAKQLRGGVMELNVTPEEEKAKDKIIKSFDELIDIVNKKLEEL